MYIFLLLAAITVVIYVVPLITRKFWDFDDIRDGGIVILILTACAGCFLFVTYGMSIQDCAEMIVYQDMISEYEALVEATKQALLDSDSDISVENFQHSTAVADRMVEVRDYRRWYKDKLANYRAHRANWFYRQYIRPLPKELKDSA